MGKTTPTVNPSQSPLNTSSWCCEACVKFLQFAWLIHKQEREKKITFVERRFSQLETEVAAI